MSYAASMSNASTIHEVNAGEFTVRAVTIQGRRFGLFWDTLTHPRDLAALAASHSGRQCFVVYSHADWDHVYGTAALENPLVIGHRICLQRFQGEAQATLAAQQAREPEKWAGVHLVPPVITFDRHLDLDLGDITVSLHHLPGHSPDSIVAFVPNLKLLLAGDAVELPCPTIPPGCNLDPWIRSLQRWREHKGVRTVIPSHGPAGGKDILDATLAYLHAMRGGCPPDLPADASDFYRAVHRDNLHNLHLHPLPR